MSLWIVGGVTRCLSAVAVETMVLAMPSVCGGVPARVKNLFSRGLKGLWSKERMKRRDEGCRDGRFYTPS